MVGWGHFQVTNFQTLIDPRRWTKFVVTNYSMKITKCFHLEQLQYTVTQLAYFLQLGYRAIGILHLLAADPVVLTEPYPAGREELMYVHVY